MSTYRVAAMSCDGHSFSEIMNDAKEAATKYERYKGKPGAFITTLWWLHDPKAGKWLMLASNVDKHDYVANIKPKYTWKGFAVDMSVLAAMCAVYAAVHHYSSLPTWATITGVLAAWLVGSWSASLSRWLTKKYL